MTRGALYIVWGDAQDVLLARSRASLRAVHPDLDVEVVRMNDNATLLDKSRMCDLSPFDETVFLDADTVVLSDLSFGFDMAQRHSLACCVCECPWARRYPSIDGDAVEYNTGVMFFTKAARSVFDQWSKWNDVIDSSITWTDGGTKKRMPYNDQAGFARAVSSLEFNPFVLPTNWNFRPIWDWSWFGPLKVWHDRAGVPIWIIENNDVAEAMDFYGLIQARNAATA